MTIPRTRGPQILNDDCVEADLSGWTVEDLSSQDPILPMVPIDQQSGLWPITE